jgi:NADH dehydrogenase (ubiquinone) Fe-S protein 1
MFFFICITRMIAIIMDKDKKKKEEEKELKVNNVTVPKLQIMDRFYYRITVLKFCEVINLQIPRFCYHDALSIAGNCRMCMIELASSTKPVVSCATTLAPGMEIYTNSFFIKHVRESVLEFLLINHPLDCPICDQGGECDLQDITFVYGSDRGRFREIKRAVEDIMISPYIKAIMTRCIHCTRCIRYFDEIAGVPMMGTMGRGVDTEVGTYVQTLLTSEIIGNVIDLCPVGALTSQPYAFQARPWELDFGESIDVLDSYCSNIRIDIRGNTILRILPKRNPSLNQHWITDRARFFYDALVYQRLVNPLVNGRIVKYNSKRQVDYYHSSWENAFAMIADEIFINICNHKKIFFFSGMYEDMPTIESLKKLASVIGPSEVNSNFINEVDIRNDFLIGFDEYIDTTYVDLDPYLHVLFYIGYNPRHESPILNIKLRRKRTSEVLSGKRKTYLIGTPILLNYKLMHVGLTYSYAYKLSLSKMFYCRYIKADKYSDYLVGPSIAYFSDTMNTYLRYLRDLLSKKGIRYQFIAANTSDLSCFEYAACAKPRRRNQYLVSVDKRTEESRTVGLIYALNCDALVLYNKNRTIEERPTLIYHGSIAGIGAQHAKIILPSVTVVDKRTIYLNIHGHIQTSAKAISLPIGVWKDHMIFLALALYLGELDSRIFQRVHRYAYNIITWSDELKLCYIQQYLRTQRLRIERVENRGIYIHDVQCQAYIQLRTSFGLDIHADEVIRMDYLKLYDPNCPGVFKQAHDIRLLRQYDGLLGWSTNLRAAEDYYYAYEVVIRKWRSKKKIKPFSNT